MKSIKGKVIGLVAGLMMMMAYAGLTIGEKVKKGLGWVKEWEAIGR